MDICRLRGRPEKGDLPGETGEDDGSAIATGAWPKYDGLRGSRRGETLLKDGVGDIVRDDARGGGFTISTAVLNPSLDCGKSISVPRSVKADTSFLSTYAFDDIRGDICISGELRFEVVGDELRMREIYQILLKA